MSDFSIRADSVDVEQIMRQIRARIRDKRGVDYTEEQIRELATAKLERFLDPGGVRSGLLEQFRRLPPVSNYGFEDTTMFESDKPVVRFFRKLLRPFLKLMFNPNVLSTTLHRQSELNDHLLAVHPLYYELLHNLVIETTRTSIEVKNLRMRVESLQSRLEFNERRARALEGVVQYKPESTRGARQERDAPAPSDVQTEPQGGVDPITGGESVRTRRRRRRRGRRSQGGAAQGDLPPGAQSGNAADEDAGDEDAGPDAAVGEVEPAGSHAGPMPRPEPPPHSPASSSAETAHAPSVASQPPGPAPASGGSPSDVEPPSEAADRDSAQ